MSALLFIPALLVGLSLVIWGTVRLLRFLLGALYPFASSSTEQVARHYGLADLACVVLHVSLVALPFRWLEEEGQRQAYQWVIGPFFGVLAVAVWWHGVKMLTLAGIKEPLRRVVFLGMVLPVAAVGPPVLIVGTFLYLAFDLAPRVLPALRTADEILWPTWVLPTLAIGWLLLAAARPLSNWIARGMRATSTAELEMAGGTNTTES